MKVIPERVLAVVAHPDDVEFGAAGTVAKWVAEGAEVTYVILTDGAIGTSEHTLTPEQVAQTRKQEQNAAAQSLGVKTVHYLDVRDGLLMPTLELRREIVKRIRETKPDVVLTTDPTTYFAGGAYINHPDHRAAGEIVMGAIYPAAESPLAFPDLTVGGYAPHRPAFLYMTFTHQPNTVIDISETMEDKLKAIRCHGSQFSEESIPLLSKRFESHGTLIGTDYAEIFRVVDLNNRAYQPDFVRVL